MILLKSVVFVLLLIVRFSHSQEDDNIKVRTKEYLLPKNVIPVHYNLHLDFNDNVGYDGVVEINLILTNGTDFIKLHSTDTQIFEKKCFLTHNGDGDERKFSVQSTVENEISRSFTFHFNEDLQPGNYTLHIEFQRTFHPYSKGIYPIFDRDVKDKYIIASQMEPIFARNAFPCYNEPNLKSTFKLFVVNKKELHAISNMPIEIQKISQNRRITEFEISPKMPVHLIALIISDFKSVTPDENSEKARIPIKIFIPPKIAEEKMELALNSTVECFNNLENLLKVPYPLPKLDAASIVGASIQSNWGLMIYGYHILIQPDAEFMTKSRAALMRKLTCKGIAYQWFGSLVTADWWDFLWLTGGFTLHYAVRAADMISPKDRYMESHMTSLLFVKTEDSILNYPLSEAFNRHVTDPDDIIYKYNPYSYKYRSSAIMRFMWLIFPNFDEAVSSYLQKNSFKNTRPPNLFTEITERTRNLPIGVSVDEVMNNWINQPGYPLITVKSIVQDSNSDKVSFEIRQERFLSNGVSSSSEKWYIPVTLTTEENINFASENIIPVAWLKDQERTITIDLDRFDGWIILNLQQVVYCRVNYDFENWLKIVNFLRSEHFEKIHVLNRIQLLDDALALIKAKKLNDKIGLSLLSYLPRERDGLVLQVAALLSTYYKNILVPEESFSEMQEIPINTTFNALKSSRNLQKQDLDEINENKEDYFIALMQIIYPILSKLDIQPVDVYSFPIR